MKVMQCVNSMNMGGIETFLMNVLRTIDKSKYQFTFACVDENKAAYDDEIVELGGKMIYMPKLRMNNPLLLIKDTIERKKFFKLNNDFDVCHIHASNAANAYFRAKYALEAGIPNVIVHAHNTGGINANINSYFRKKLNKLNIKRVACSKEAGEWLFKDKTFDIILNAIDLDKFAYKAEVGNRIKSENSWQNRFVIGHVGRFYVEKNHTFLIDIFKSFHDRHNDSLLVLIGSGELENEIREKINRLGLEQDVVLLGNKKNVNEYYQAMDVFVFPSLYEGLPLVVIEAQISGLRVLLSDMVSKDVIISKECKLLSLNDTQSWIDELEKIYNSRKRELVYNESKNKFDIKNVTNQLIDLYNN